MVCRLRRGFAHLDTDVNNGNNHAAHVDNALDIRRQQREYCNMLVCQNFGDIGSLNAEIQSVRDKCQILLGNLIGNTGVFQLFTGC